MKSYVFPYNAEWVGRYHEEAKKIKSAAPINTDLHHVGSTAIPNMHAKDCIDIVGVVDDFEDGRKLVNPLIALGYEYRSEYGIKGRHYFAKEKEEKVHLHIFPKGSNEIKKHLHFVRVMSNDPDLVEEFIRVKKRLQELYPNDRLRYQQEKAFFYDKVTRITEKA